jgi:hypothetical protein
MLWRFASDAITEKPQEAIIDEAPWVGHVPVGWIARQIGYKPELPRQPLSAAVFECKS